MKLVSFTCIVILVACCHLSVVRGWPEGTFGLPMPKTGCPQSAVVNWEIGSRTQRTEEGSHASENVHLAGVEPTPANYVVQLFCMKMSFPQEGDYTWMPGKYCVFKKVECPAEFYEGYIYWDDNAKWFSKNDNRQNSRGVLPDGDYNQNTKIFFCCRTDGSPLSPIRLPSSAPFYLLKYGERCQEVESMFYTEEWVYWADESSHNLNAERGFHPAVIRNRFSPVYTKLSYCYYQPKPPNQVLQSVLTAVYVIAGVIGSIIILVVFICVTVHLYMRCRRHKHVDGTSNSSSTHVLPTVDCHYVTVLTSDVTASTPSAPTAEFDCTSDDHTNDCNSRPDSSPPSYEEVVGLPVGFVCSSSGKAS